MISFPNAKINMGLRVIRKLASGFHEIESILFPVPLSDALEIVPANGLKMYFSGIPVEGNYRNNLCYRAWEMLHHDFKIKPVHIHLHKHIPMGAGLGGGSSDAAFTLKMLNSLFDLQLYDEQLEKYAAKLGTDCPFFIANEPAMVSGTGTILTSLNMPKLTGYFLVLVIPHIYMNTAEAYAGIKPVDSGISLQRFSCLAPGHWKDAMENDFEASIFKKHPAIKRIKQRMYEN